MPVDPQLGDVELVGQAAPLALNVVLGAAHLGGRVDQRHENVEVYILPIAQPPDDLMRSLIEHNG